MRIYKPHNDSSFGWIIIETIVELMMFDSMESVEIYSLYNDGSESLLEPSEISNIITSANTDDELDDILGVEINLSEFNPFI